MKDKQKKKYLIDVGTAKNGRVLIQFKLDGIEIPKADFESLLDGSTDTPAVRWGAAST